MNNVLFTKIIFSRNLKDYKFIPKLTNENKEEIIKKIQEVFDGEMKTLTLNKLSQTDVKFLKDNRLLCDKSTFVLVDKKKNTALNLFAGEHISIVSTMYGFDITSYKHAKEKLDILTSKVSLAFSDEYGYLMSDITKIGAGLEIISYVYLDGIKAINKIDQVKLNMKKLGYNLSNTENNKIYTISTKCNLGKSEQEIFEDFEKVLLNLSNLEKESSKVLDISNHEEIVDKSYRTRAILESAYMMKYDELNELLSNIRIGKNLDIIDIKNKDLIELEKLVFNKGAEFIGKSELIELAERVKKIMKGE